MMEAGFEPGSPTRGQRKKRQACWGGDLLSPACERTILEGGRLWGWGWEGISPVFSNPGRRHPMEVNSFSLGVER